MYIQPNTTIKILKNVPLDNGYKHTIYFNNKTDQLNYFNSKVAHTFTDLSYQRVNRNVCRLPIKADSIYDCNYLMFQNASFGTKYFYAFIIGVEYVSNEVCEVQFEIDVLQTWQTDITFKECYVVREHAMVDNIGSNTIPENIPVGNKILYNSTNYVSLNDTCIVLQSTIDVTKSNEDDTVAPFFESESSVVCTTSNLVYLLTTDGLENLNNTIITHAQRNKLDAIVSIKQVPLLCTKRRNEDALQLDILVDDAYGDYTPHNKKLYTGDYCCAMVDDSNGNQTELYFEKSGEAGSPLSHDIHIVIEGSTFPEPFIRYYPLSYEGVPRNYAKTQTFSNFMNIAPNIESFTSMLASQQNKLASGVVADALKTAIGGLLLGGGAGAIAGGVTGMFGSAIQTTGRIMDYRNLPPKTVGQMGGNYLNIKYENNNIYGYIYALDRPSVEKLDKYFDTYGYATNTTKVPNINGRPAWNYVQTNGCIAVGNAPSDDLAKICSIMDNGITWWKSGDGVGNYSQNNQLPST